MTRTVSIVFAVIVVLTMVVAVGQLRVIKYTESQCRASDICDFYCPAGTECLSKQFFIMVPQFARSALYSYLPETPKPIITTIKRGINTTGTTTNKNQ